MFWYMDSVYQHDHLFWLQKCPFWPELDQSAWIHQHHLPNNLNLLLWMDDCNSVNDYHTLMSFDSFFYQNAPVCNSRPIKLSTFHTYIVCYTWNFMKTAESQKQHHKTAKPKFPKMQSVLNTSAFLTFTTLKAWAGNIRKIYLIF